MDDVNGPADDFDAWYRRTHPRVVSVIAGVTGDRDIAADAADEAFARALERWDRVASMDSPAAWLYTTALNAARRRFRRRRIERQVVGGRPEPLPGPAGELWMLVASLPVRRRTAVVLRHVAQLTEPEIAAVMGVSRGTVSATLRQAYAVLRTQLDDDESFEERIDDVAAG